MVGTAALRHRAAGVARLVASRELVALRLESGSHSVLWVERDSLRKDLLFLAGKSPRVTELFRGNAVDLVLARARLKEEAARADVVVAPWKFLEQRPEALKWHLFLDALLEVAPSLEAQLQRVAFEPARRRLESALENKSLEVRISRAQADVGQFYSQLYLPFTRHQQGNESGLDSKKDLEQDFREGGAIALVSHRGKLVAGALLLTRRGGRVSYHRHGLAQAGTLSAAELAERTAALEAAVFRGAHELGAQFIDFGFVPSLMSDPRFVHRRLLGCTFASTPSHPALMLELNPRVRPELFARAPLLTGEAGALVAQTGLVESNPPSERAMRKTAENLRINGLEKVTLSTDALPNAPLRVLYERVLREEGLTVSS
jgi:hypothetical protein